MLITRKRSAVGRKELKSVIILKGLFHKPVTFTHDKKRSVTKIKGAKNPAARISCSRCRNAVVYT